NRQLSPTRHTHHHTLSLHDALPISEQRSRIVGKVSRKRRDLGLAIEAVTAERLAGERSAGDRGEFLAPARDHCLARCAHGCERKDRKSTRLNSSHVAISYAVFCLQK